MDRHSAAYDGMHAEYSVAGDTLPLIPRARRHGPCRKLRSACKTAARLTAEGPILRKGNPMLRLPV